MKNNILLVSICCTTYNHSPYIRQCLDGFVMQKTDFVFEVLIHDDASTDDNQKIIKEYEKQYPNLIKPIYQTENQYSKGKNPFFDFNAPRVKGKYIALCEGDDYWTDPYKLQKQVDFFEKNSDVSMSVTPVFKVEHNKLIHEPLFFYGNNVRFFSTQEVLDIPGQFAATSSYMFKKSVVSALPNFFLRAPVGDLFLELWASKYGEIAYVPETMSVYRVNALSSWTVTQMENKISNLLILRERMRNSFVELSKEDGFENINWNKKEASWALLLSLYYLDEKNYVAFRKEITLSYSYVKNSSLTQIVCFQFRYFPILLRTLRLLFLKFFFK